MRPSDILAVTIAGWKMAKDMPGSFRDYLKISRWPQEERVRRYVLLLKAYRDIALARNATLLILSDSAWLKVPSGVCKPTPLMPNAGRKCELSQEDMDANRLYFREQLAILARGPGVLFFDPFHLFCGHGKCGALIPGTNKLAYFGRDHWSTAGSLYVWPFLCSFLSKNGLDICKEV